MNQEKNGIWQWLRSSVRPFDRPHHYAMAVALGTMIGLVPKFSAIPFAIALIALLSPANLGMLICATIVATVLSIHLDPFSNQIGERLLNDPALESHWKSLAAQPYAIWLQFHNTVVVGSTAIALALQIPIYIVTRIAAYYLKPIVERICLRNPIANWIRGYPLPT